MTMLVSILFLLLTLLICILILFLVACWYRTQKTNFSPRQKIFIKGTIPHNLPDGFYKGSVPGYELVWVGKEFDRENQTGINVLSIRGKTSKRYPFKMYIDKGIHDKNLGVIKIDYNISQNPVWLRPILDEIVQTDTNTYLGKVSLRLIPGFPFSLGFFYLKKDE